MEIAKALGFEGSVRFPSLFVAAEVVQLMPAM